MEFSEKGTINPMNGHFSPINELESVNGIQFSLCGTPANLIFAHRVVVIQVFGLEYSGFDTKLVKNFTNVRQNEV